MKTNFNIRQINYNLLTSTALTLRVIREICMLTYGWGRVKYIVDMIGKSGCVPENSLSTNSIVPDYPAILAVQLGFFSQCNDWTMGNLGLHFLQGHRF
jgi:hypothetical protein